MRWEERRGEGTREEDVVGCERIGEDMKGEEKNSENKTTEKFITLENIQDIWKGKQRRGKQHIKQIGEQYKQDIYTIRTDRPT